MGDGGKKKEGLQRAGGRAEFPDGILTVLHDHKPVAAKLQRLRLAPGPARRCALEAMGTTSRPAAVLVQVSAPDVEHGFHVQIAFAFPQLEKVDPLGVPQEPRGLMIEAGGPLLELPYPEGHVEALALGA